MRSLTFAVGLSLLAVGLLGVLASEFETQERAIPLSEALRSPEGSRVLVRGLLEDVREVAGGAALSTLSDCTGARVTVFFAGGAPANVSWRLVVLDASVAFYRGAPEFVVDSPSRAAFAAGPPQVVEAVALRENWRAFLCRAVSVTAPLSWANVSKEESTAFTVGLAAGAKDLRVAVHCGCLVELTVYPGTVATYIGVVAASADGTEPVVHVRL